MRRGSQPGGRRRKLPWAALLRVALPWAAAMRTVPLGCMWLMTRRFGPCERMPRLPKALKILTLPAL